MLHGLSNEEVVTSRKEYGTNSISNIKKNSFFRMLLESLGDPIIKILLVPYFLRFCSTSLLFRP